MVKKDVEQVVDDTFKKVDLAVNDPKTLILALNAQEHEVCAKACDALDKFAASSDKNRDELKNAGVLEALTPLLSSSVEVVRNVSTCLMATITKSFEVRRAIRSKGLPVIEQLVRLAVPAEGAVVRENACLALANLATEFSARSEIYKSGAIEPLVAFLSASEPEVVRAALKALILLSEEYQCRDTFGQTGGIEALVGLLASEYNELQQLCIECITGVAKNQANRQLLIDQGGLQRLIEVVSNSEYAASHIHALNALSTLVYDSRCMQVLSEPGPPAKDGSTPPPIVRLLGFLAPANTPDIQVHAANCITRAAGNPDNRRLLFDNKAEEMLVKRLSSEDPKLPVKPQVAAAAARALTALAQSKSSSEVIGRCQAIPVLLKLMTNEDVVCVTASLSLLNAIVTEVPENRKAMSEADGIVKFTDVYKRGTNNDQKTIALQFFTSMCKYAPARQGLKTPDAVSLIVGALRDSDKIIQANGLLLATALAADDDFRREFVNQQGLGEVLKLVQSTDENLSQVASRAVFVLATDKQIAAKLTSLQALDILQKRDNSVNHSHAPASTAFEQILRNNLSAKFALRNRLDLDDILTEPFYDIGRVQRTTSVPSLESLCQGPVDAKRPVFLVNLTSVKVVIEPAPEPAVDDKKSKKQANAPKKVHAQEVVPVSTWKPPTDSHLIDFVNEMKESAGILGSDKKKIVEAFATAVATRMGGAVAKDDIGRLNVEISLADLKTKLGSNVIPLGQVRVGSYDHRALLLKLLLDQVNIPNVLVRADFGRSYNVVYLPDGEVRVVDVMHQPGSLHRIDDVHRLNRATNFFG